MIGIGAWQIGHRLARVEGGQGGAVGHDGKAGVMVLKKVGEQVEAGTELARLMTDVEAAGRREAEGLLSAFDISSQAPAHVPALISHVVSRSGVVSWAEYQAVAASA